MPGFGRFETVEELASSGPFTVYSARQAGEEGPPKFVIKTFRSADEFAEQEVVDREAAAFIAAAKLQQSLAAGGKGHWATVHEMGRTPEAAYFISDLYPQSCQKMIDSRRDLDARTIAWIIGSVADGLIELRAQGNGRGHGALKPSNVLIASRAELYGSPVVLCDPLPDERLESGAQTQDLKELAGLLFQLVVHRGPPRGGEVRASPEWARLGAAGEALRNLCESLINPHPGEPLLTLEQVKERLAGAKGAKEKGKGGLPLAVKVGIAAVLVGGAGVGAWVGLSGGKGEKGTNGHNGENGGGGVVVVPDVDPEPTEIRVTEGKDPTPADWQVKELADLKARLDAAAAELTAEGGVGAERLAALASRAAAAEALAKELRDRPWDMVEEAAPEGSGAAPVMRAVTKEEQEKIVQQANKAALDVYEIKKDVVKARSDSRDRLTDLVSSERAWPGGDGGVQSEMLKAVYVRGLALIDPRDEKANWVSARATVDRLRAWVKEIEGEMAAAVEVAAPAGTAMDFAGLGVVVAAKREAAIEAAAEPMLERRVLPAAGDAAEATRRASIKEQLDSWATGARDALLAAAEIERLMSLGYGFTEAPAGAGKPITALRTEVTGAKSYADIRRVVDGVLERAAALEATEALKTSVEMIEAIRVAERDGTVAQVSSLMTAWRKLPGAEYPKDGAELAQAPPMLLASVRPILEKVPDLDRRTALVAEAEGVLKTMWLTFVLERANGTPGAVDAAFKAMGTFGMRATDVASMAPWVQYNYGRWELLNAVAGLKPPANKAEAEIQQKALMELVKAFDDKVGGLGVDGRVRAAEMKRKLQGYRVGKMTDFAESGPGKMKWAHKELDDEGAAVEYTWANPPSGKARTLVFRRTLEAESGEWTGYMCTEEVSLGLFIDLVTAAGKWSDVEKLLAYKATDASDSRRGPRVWQWVEGGGAMRPCQPLVEEKEPDPTGNGWMKADLVKVPYYGNGVEPPLPPSAEDPMNYVSPKAAVFAASLAGCRLPATVEWEAAITLEPPVPLNLRDERWSKHHAYIQSIQELVGRRAELPNGGIFRKPTPPAQRVQNEVDNKPVVAADDGWLWFAPVSEGKGLFRHLVGNVAELTFNAPASLDAITVPTTEVVHKTLGKGDEFRVVGASALSSEDQPANTPYPLTSWSSGIAGYSDVGFRLAFSTSGGAGGAGKAAERLAQLLRGTDYLSATNN